MTKKIAVDFHCHSSYSPDSLNKIEDLIRAARQQGIDRLVITDHNTIQGALLAQQIAPDLIIVGEEIETSDGGEILAAFVQQEVPGGIPYREALSQLQEQGAFISMSHPFDDHRQRWPVQILESLVGVLDAVETFNSRAARPQVNLQARLFAERFNLPGTAGSDAHTIREVGRARVILPEFQNAEELRHSMKDSTVEGVLSSGGVRLLSRWAVWRKVWAGK